MGYSCTVKADYALTSMLTQLQSASSREHKASNTWDRKGRDYFFEQGREHEDGAITGMVFSLQGRRIGSARIDENGTVERWPTSTAAQRKASKAISAGNYALHYGGGLTFQTV